MLVTFLKPDVILTVPDTQLPYPPLCTSHSTGHVVLSVPATQLAISSSLYRPLNWSCHPHWPLSCHIILSVPAAQLAMSFSLYRPLNWQCQLLCTSRSTGHVILTVPATQLPYYPLCTSHSPGHVILSVPATQLAMSLYLYRPLNWPCHPHCIGHLAAI